MLCALNKAERTGSVLCKAEQQLEDHCETEAHTNDTVFFFSPLLVQRRAWRLQF